VCLNYLYFYLLHVRRLLDNYALKKGTPTPAQKQIQQFQLTACEEEVEEPVSYIFSPHLHPSPSSITSVDNFIRMPKSPDARQKEFHLADPVCPTSMDALKKSFVEFDIDGDGFISKEELSRVIGKVGKMVRPEELDQMYEIVDKDGNGLLDFKEFIDLMDANCLCTDNDAEIEELFKLFDVDKDGYITEKEISGVLKQMGEKVRKKDIRKMIKAGDKNKDKQISFNEFKDMIENGQFLQ